MAARHKLHISYLYDMELPSRLAASIRIINSLHPLAMSGIPVTLYTSAMHAGSVAECMAFYGLPDPENLQIKPLLDFSDPGGPMKPELAAALSAAGEDSDHVVITRGESGIELMRQFRLCSGFRHVRFIFEAHRLCYLHARENGESETEVQRVWQLEREAVTGADGLICVTPAVLQELEDEFQANCPSTILPNGAVLPDISAISGTRNIDILYVGKLQERKGVQTLVQAMQFLPGRRAHIIGGNPVQLDKLKKLAQDLGVSDRLVFRGYLPPAEVYALLATVRVGVCPLPEGISVIADRFTCPIKILEMMAWGVPIVASNMGTVRALLEHNRTALLVPPNDPEALARGLENLLTDRPRGEALSRAARREVETQSWADRARQLRKFVESI